VYFFILSLLIHYLIYSKENKNDMIKSYHETLKTENLKLQNQKLELEIEVLKSKLKVVKI